jgi:3-phenylpropionate/cinnamic acid dioxygenase small subunit
MIGVIRRLPLALGYRATGGLDFAGVFPMTVDELLAREGIRQTLAAYTMSGDRLRVEDFIAVFTEDGVLESEGVPESDAFRYTGREEIRNWLSRWRASDGSTQAHQATFIRHHLSTSQIELAGPDIAKVRTYWTAYTDTGPDHCGYYVDVLRKTGERWLIAHRRVRLDWRSPHSLFVTAILRTRSQ